MFVLLLQSVATLAITQASDSVTLSDALTRAETTRPRLTAAAASVERARGLARLASAIPNPTSQLEKDQSAPTIKVTVVQSLAWLPRRGADLSTGRAILARGRADSAQSVADVGRDVRRAFYGALAADRRLELAAEQGMLADSLARLATRRAAAGDISDLERDQIVLDASRSRLTAAHAREDAALARRELARAIAWPSAAGPRPIGRLDETLDDGATGMSPDSPRSLDSIPVVASARADSAAAASRFRAARISRIPVPGLVGGREWGGGAAHNMILGVSLALPIWSRGGESIQETRGAAAEQSALAAEVRLVARARLDAARGRAAESLQRARFARDTLLPEARRVRAGAVRLYEAGQTSVVPMLDALRSERDVTRDVIAELLAFQEARADLTAIRGQWR